jgi:hypothetical protein
MRGNRRVLCAAALLLGAAGPERAPTRFTTHDFGLTAVIPPGLVHCPTPVGWAGGDHGITVYLTPPLVCDGGAPQAAADEAERLPQIRLYYVRNAAAGSDGGGPPRSNAALHRQACGETLSDWPVRMAMLGVPAATCFAHRGDVITLAVGTLYRQERAGSVDALPDSIVWLVLQTNAARYVYDLGIFRTALLSVRQCRAPERAVVPARPGCPARVGGW